MRMSRFAAIVAVSVICAIPAFAQNSTNPNTTKIDTTKQPSKQPTQGLPQSMANPQYGSAQKQKAQGLPASMADPQYGGANNPSAQKQQ